MSYNMKSENFLELQLKPEESGITWGGSDEPLQSYGCLKLRGW